MHFGICTQFVVCRIGGAIWRPFVESDCVLEDDVEIEGGQGSDTIKILTSGDASVICAGKTISSGIDYTDGSNHNYMDVYGDSGDDILTTGEDDTIASGVENHDRVFGRTDWVYIAGGSGEDDVIGSYGPDGNELQGDGELDCLVEIVGASGFRLAARFDCGTNNFDEYVPLGGVDTGTEINCEDDVPIIQGCPP